jgi:major histocompatibility complex class I
VGGSIPGLVVLGSIRKQAEPGVVAHAFNPSTREAEAGGFLSSRPAWSTE